MVPKLEPLKEELKASAMVRKMAVRCRDGTGDDMSVGYGEGAGAGVTVQY